MTEYRICALRGRMKDGEYIQMLEVFDEPYCHSLTTVAKDNLVMETDRIIVKGMLSGTRYGKEQNRRVYDPKGIAPGIQTMQGGNREPKVIVNERDETACSMGRTGREDVRNLVEKPGQDI